MNIHITAKNAFTRVKEVDLLTEFKEGENVDHIHKILSAAFPDCFVNFDMGERGFIAGQPHNMVADERSLYAGLISWEDYVAKWYSNLA